MIFPNKPRINLASIGRPPPYNSGSTNIPHSSNQLATNHQQPPGSRRNLGVNPSQGGFTTAILIVSALGGFLFACGLFMLFGGFGGHAQSLVGLGMASVIGGILFWAMGWRLCLNMKRNRHHHEGHIYYRTTLGLPTGQVVLIGTPPAYSHLPITSGLITSEESTSSLGVSYTSGPQPIHSTLSFGNAQINGHQFPCPPPSYDEAVRNG